VDAILRAAAVSLPPTLLSTGEWATPITKQTAFNGTTLSFDANGNLTGDGTYTYTYDTRNHLTVISGGTNASLA
jgi:hypothetical protein